MALITADLSEVSSPLEPGTYKARVMSSTVKESQAGKPYVKWQLETWGSDVKSHNGRTVYYNTPVTGGGAFRLADLYVAAMKTVLPKDNPAFDTDMLVGKEVEITLIEGKDMNGEPSKYPEVKTVKPIH